MPNGMRRLLRWTVNRFRSREFSPDERFTGIYERNSFGGEESHSGTGSSLKQTAFVRQELPGLFERHCVQTLLDAPCGDCHWMSLLDWKRLRYHGVDVVEPLIKRNQTRITKAGMTFARADLCTDALPAVDLIFCRDCWVHLTYRQIDACLRNFQGSGSRFLLTTTFNSRGSNRDLRTGVIWRPLNLQCPPFNFPDPVEVVLERCTEDGGKFADKALGLWRLADLKPLAN